MAFPVKSKGKFPFPPKGGGKSDSMDDKGKGKDSGSSKAEMSGKDMIAKAMKK